MIDLNIGALGDPDAPLCQANMVKQGAQDLWQVDSTAGSRPPQSRPVYFCDQGVSETRSAKH